MSNCEKNIRRWVKYGILWSFGPYIFIVFIGFIVGTINLETVLPGLLLTVFAVGINALGTLDEEKEHLFPHTLYCKDMLQIVSAICIGIYGVLFLLSDLPIKINFDILGSITDNRMNILLGITIVCCFLNCVSVIYVEIKIHKEREKRKQQKIQQNTQKDIKGENNEK